MEKKRTDDIPFQLISSHINVFLVQILINFNNL